MPPSPLASLASSYLQALQSLLSGGVGKKLATALAVIAGLIWMWRRVEAARQAERINHALRDARGNVMPVNVALGQHAPSPLPPSHAQQSDKNDVRNLAPADRFLSEKGSRVQRQTVCLTLSASNRSLFQQLSVDSESSLQPTLQLQLTDAVVPILIGLAQNTALHCIVIEADKARQAAVLASLEDLFSLGLKRHRVLFCTTVKGKSAMVRHIEPHLCIDDDRAVLGQLKQHIEQVVHLDPSGLSSARDGITSYPSLRAFFMPSAAATAS